MTETGTLSPQALAEACAAQMWADDRASQSLGMRIVSVGPGTASLTMTVREDMANGHGIAHGGFIFALADSTFAFACNSYNERTVAAHCQISYLRPGRVGDLLVSAAVLVHRSGRSGIYDVRVSAGESVIAEFRGHSRSIGGALLG